MKCVRCGHEWSGDGKPHKLVTCPHCQLMMTLDESSDKRVKHAGAFLIFVIATVMGYGLWDWSEKGNYWVMFVSLTCAIVLLNFIDGLTLRLAAWKRPLTYRALSDEERDEILRQRSRKIVKEKEKGKKRR